MVKTWERERERNNLWEFWSTHYCLYYGMFQLVRKVRSSSTLNSSDSPSLLLCYCTHGICWRIHGDQWHLCASLKDWNERLQHTSFRWLKCLLLTLLEKKPLHVCVCVLLLYWLYTHCQPSSQDVLRNVQWLHRCSWWSLVEESWLIFGK